jgi:hypothetical protein
MSLPVLLVCYLRPKDLASMLESKEINKRNIYIFIDSTQRESDIALNQEVIKVANEFNSQRKINIQISTRNLGVGAALPEAVNWISSFESEFIVLEDDCHLTAAGFEFFERYVNKLDSEYSILCATSPFDLQPISNLQDKNTTSAYPIISGWASSSQSWKQISRLIGGKVPLRETIARAIQTPTKVLPLLFFLAASIRVRKGSLKAWDSSVALAMLLDGKKSLIPNLTMVTNTGRDSVASHTLPAAGEDKFFRIASEDSPSNNVSNSAWDEKLTNQEIEKKIFNLKWRHLLSPLKALVN